MIEVQASKQALEQDQTAATTLITILITHTIFSHESGHSKQVHTR